MIKFVYSSKNKLSGNFNTPVYHDFPKDAAVEAFSISAQECNDPKVSELEVYYLGTFDTKTGVMTNEVEFLVDLGSVVHGKRNSAN